MTLIVQYLSSGALPEDCFSVRKLLLKANQYTLKDGVLYKKSYLCLCAGALVPKKPSMCCKRFILVPVEATLNQVLARQVLHHGYYWPTIVTNAEALVQKCVKC